MERRKRRRVLAPLSSAGGEVPRGEDELGVEPGGESGVDGDKEAMAARHARRRVGMVAPLSCEGEGGRRDGIFLYA